MYADMKLLLKKIDSNAEDLIEFSPEDTRVAVAVLLFRVIIIDGKVRDSEIKRFREIVQDHLNVEPDELLLFENMVRQRIACEETLAPSAEIISKMPSETKREILNFMKEISISDNEFHEFEINLVTRVSSLFGMPVD